MKLTILKTAVFSAALAGSLAAFAASPNGPAATVTAHAAHPSQTLPGTLRPVLYQALAKDAGPAYDLDSKGCATLRKLKACFDSNGAHFVGVGSPLALRLTGYGRGAALSPMNPVQPEINRSHVNYKYGDLIEWWRVLPMGFEQGFTLAKRPNGHGKLMLALVTSGRARKHHDSLGWGRLRYGDLVVTDAKGKAVPATMKSAGNHILIAINDTHAAYPLTVDPLVWLEQKVTASDGATGDEFGISVALDGTTALIGAVYNESGRGAAYVFTESNGVWSETQKLTAGDSAEGDWFGQSVTLDGNTALVGAAEYLSGGPGAAYVFTKSDGTWNMTQKLTADDGVADDQFGISVALDGTTALIGAFGGDYDRGAAYVFTDSGGTWSQEQKLTASDASLYAAFGVSVALDDTTALIGAYGDNSYQGAAYVFTDSNGTWNQTQKLTASDGTANSHFGISVALDGDSALIGAEEATVGENSHQGAAYVFADSGDVWSEVQKLVSSDGAQWDFFGRSVALDGPTALVSAYGPNAQQGAAYLFTESNGTWNEARKLVASDGAPGDQFGIMVALSGSTALVGADGDDSFQGAAYFYGASDLGLNVSAPETVGQGQQYVSQTVATNNASAATPAVSATIAVPAAASFVSATASQGSCGEASGVVTCDFGQIADNGGTATANVTLKATGNVGDTIENVSGIAKATPPLSASAATTITAGGACPGGYSEYDGTLNAGKRRHSPIYQAPAGVENAILTGPSGFQLYAVFQNAQGRKVFRIPGNEVHRQAPAGTFTWVVQAGHSGGAFTLCVLHP